MNLAGNLGQGVDDFAEVHWPLSEVWREEDLLATLEDLPEWGINAMDE